MLRKLSPVASVLALAAASLCGATHATTAVTKTVRAGICGHRAACRITRVFDAGTSAGGVPLAVAEIHLGLADKPADAPAQGCRNDDGFDGGAEWWLVEARPPAQRLLKLCNDGYGAAGIGEDHVTVGANRFTHAQLGG